jgi:hypothetical protein
VLLDAYFSALPVAEASDEDLLIHLRRLVFSRVNQGIFRLFNEADPSLGKIIRNIKLALQSLRTFVEFERFGEPCIAPIMCETLEALPPIEIEELERALVRVTRSGEHVPGMLAKLSVYLREQNTRSRILPLISAAHVLRSAYSIRNTNRVEAIEVEASFSETDSVSIVKEACLEVKIELMHRYTLKGKVSEEIFLKYFEGIERHLCEKLVHQNGYDASLFEALQMVWPELSKEDYRKKHRSRLEYLHRIALQRAVAKLKANQ